MKTLAVLTIAAIGIDAGCAEITTRTVFAPPEMVPGTTETSDEPAGTKSDCKILRQADGIELLATRQTLCHHRVWQMWTTRKTTVRELKSDYRPYYGMGAAAGVVLVIVGLVPRDGLRVSVNDVEAESESAGRIAMVVVGSILAIVGGGLTIAETVRQTDSVEVTRHRRPEDPAAEPSVCAQIPESDVHIHVATTDGNSIDTVTGPDGHATLAWTRIFPTAAPRSPGAAPLTATITGCGAPEILASPSP